MLARNDLLQYAAPRARTVRVLWISPDRVQAYLFDVADKSAEVEPASMAALAEDLAAGRARLLEHDAHLVLKSAEQLPDKYRQLRARAWEIIEPLTRHEPDIYEPRLRGQLVAHYTRLYGVSHPTIYRYLRRYWQRGQTPNALLPDYANSGARGKVRAASAGVKRGRPRQSGTDPGLNADEEIRMVFRVAVARYAAQHLKFSRRGAFRQMLGEFFRARRIDLRTGRVEYPADAAAQPLPTFGQFSYWLDRDLDRPAGIVRRVSRGARPAPPAPDCDESRLPPGQPGEAYQLDAVLADVQLVSRADRAQLAGRPLVYVTLDRYSGMVTGLAVSLERHAATQAMLAVANSGADKARFCQRHGRLIGPQEWPSRHLPANLLVPPELAGGWNGDILLHNFGVHCMAAGAAPAPWTQWRTVLARRFRLLAPNADGAASRLDGVLDLEQFTRVVIDCVLYYNNGGAADQGLAPRALWELGAARRGVARKPYPEQLVRCCLLPRALATVTADGIRLHDSYYTCARAIEEDWFGRARLRGQWSVKVGYDPADLATIYLPDAGAALQFHACHMMARSQQHQHLSASEVALLRQRRRDLLEGIEQACADDLRRGAGAHRSGLTV